MNIMHRSRIGLMALAGLLAFSMCASAGQGYGQPQQQPGKSPQEPSSLTLDTVGPAATPEEEAAFKAFNGIKNSDFQKKITAGEEFVKKFPKSRHSGSVYSGLAGAYLAAGQEEKMFAAGERALALTPDNVDMLSLMAMMVPLRLQAGSLDADQKLQDSEKYARKAIELLTALTKPEGFSDEDFNHSKNQKLSMAHTGLGLIFFHRQKFAEAATELKQATTITPTPDEINYYVLGLSLYRIKQFNEAADAFGHCAQGQGPLVERCKQSQVEVKKLAANQLAPPKQP
jgi:tetratricopeptide (TPR) repeat protein